MRSDEGKISDPAAPPATGLHAHLKEVARPWVRERHESPVLRGIFDGTLDPAVMRRWIEQDRLYLRTYTRVLARLAALAPDHHVTTLVDGAHYTAHIEVERLEELADDFGADLEGATVGPACRAYADYLVEHAETFPTGVIAVLPCMIGFAAVGLTVDTPTEPRYRRWVEIYAAPDFQGYATRFAEVVDDLGIDRRGARSIFEAGMAMEQRLWDDAAAGPLSDGTSR